MVKIVKSSKIEFIFYILKYIYIRLRNICKNVGSWYNRSDCIRVLVMRRTNMRIYRKMRKQSA